MNKFQIFKSSEFGSIGVVVNEGEPWFIAKDVSEILGYMDSEHMARRLPANEKKNVKQIGFSFEVIDDGNPTEAPAMGASDVLKNKELEITDENPSSMQSRRFTIISEPGLYRAIFGSQKPTAEAFKTWVCSEVLPALRKHGAYMTPSTVQSILADPRKAIELLTELVREQDARKQAESEKEQAIKERAWISDRKTATAMATASALSRKVSKLQEELGSSKKAASILRVSIALGVPEKSFAWYHLKKTTLELNLEIRKVSDPRFGYANLYPSEAWKAAYGIDLEELFGN
jgi:prophage antirepressor-like protein